MKKKSVEKLTLNKDFIYKIADFSLESIQGGRIFTVGGRLSICCTSG